MIKDQNKELKQLKADYFELEENRREERKILIKAINTFSILAGIPENTSEDLAIFKGMINQEGALPIFEIEDELRKIKEKIFETEGMKESDKEEPDMLLSMEEKVADACRIMKRIMAALLEDFYPLSEELENTAENIRIDCKGDIMNMDLKEPATELLNFIDRIKVKISDDFRSVNRIFLSLLDQVKELEKSLAVEFGGQRPLKEIEYFEMKINQEVGSIADSFNVYSTISEVKETVFEKLKNIKSLVTLRKDKDLKKAKIARENIIKLKKRIDDVEKDALKMSKKAEIFKEAALRDGLTSLYNRSAFDMKIKDAIASFSYSGKLFSIILFDVDKFKNINDSFGHVAGDKVLVKVAECLVESFRKDDFIARFGGDEFVVIIEELTPQMARDRIEAFRRNLRKRKFVSYKDGEIDLKVSTGTAAVSKGDTPESIIERADKAMYENKHKK